jgi:hypothetical protein
MEMVVFIIKRNHQGNFARVIMSSNIDLLGEIVAWDINSGRETHVDFLRTALEASKIDISVEDLSNISAFGRACTKLREDRAIDKVVVGKHSTKFQLTDRANDGDRIDYSYRCTVEIDHLTGDITCNDTEILHKAVELFDHARCHRSNQDISRLVQRLFKRNSELYALNSKGVAYFVPQKFVDFTAKVERFLSFIGGRLSRFPVPRGTEEGNRSVKHAVADGLSGLITELNTAVLHWTDSTTKGAMESALRNFDKIEFKVSAYADYLESEQGRLLEEVKKAREIVKTKYDHHLQSLVKC